MVTPNRASSVRSRRVSSAAIRSAVVSASISAGLASEESPIGVPASTRTVPASVAHCGSRWHRGSPTTVLHTLSTRECARPAEDVASPEGADAPPAPPPPPTTLERLRVPPLTDRLAGWLVTLAVTAIAFVLRVAHLGRPNALIFDETYYAKDAYSLLRFGYERSWPEDANARILAGNPDVMNNASSFIVHPQLGKWLIAAGEHFFGMTSVGWRVGPLIVGTLLVLVLTRLVRRVSRSTLIGGIAGLLLAFDGLAYVMSRVALLDIFLAFFVVAAVACLAADRDWFRNRLADHLENHDQADLGGRFGPALIVRPWRIAAGLCFGLALGSKWNALYVLAAFALLSLAWDVGARRLAGAGSARVHGDPARRRTRVRLAGAAVRGRLPEHLDELAGQHRRARPRLGRQPPGGVDDPLPGRRRWRR